MSAPMPRWWLRQVALLAADRDEAARAIAETFGLAVCHQADAIAGYSMANALLAVGDRFVEVATPLDDTSPAGRLLAKRGEGGYLVILQTDDIATARERVESAGASVTIELEHADARELHLHPKTTGGVALALDWMEPESSWRWAGADWKDTVHNDIVLSLVGVTITADDPESVAARWSELLGIPTGREPEGTVIALERGTWLRFVRNAGAAPALVAVHLEASTPGDSRSMRIGDCEIRAD